VTASEIYGDDYPGSRDMEGYSKQTSGIQMDPVIGEFFRRDGDFSSPSCTDFSDTACGSGS
jgi:hypothetical protein